MTEGKQSRHPAVIRAQEASKLLARGSGIINMAIEAKQLTRRKLREVADLAREAAAKLDEAASCQ